MITRRRFIQNSSLATAGLMVAKPEWFKSPSLIGLQLYTVRNEISKDVAGTIAKVASIGYNSVEVFGYGNGKFFGLTPQQFRSIIDQNHLKTPSGHYGLPDFLKKGDEDDLKRHLEAAKIMGHEFFVVPYLTEDLRTSLDDYRRLTERLNKAGEASKSSGMNLAYHNHDFEFKDWGDGQRGMDILLSQTDHALVNFEMDIFWITKAGVDPIHFIQANPGRIKLWHVKDMDSNKTFTEVGTGIIDYRKIFQHRKESGMEYFFVEQDETKIPVFDSIAKSLQYIKKNIEV